MAARLFEAVTAMGDPGMNLISPDAATRRKGIAYMKWAIDCAAALGANRLSGPVHSTLGAFTGVGPTAAEKKRSVGSQRAIGDHAGNRGVTIGLEALNRFECYLLNTMADLSAHVDEIDRPTIGRWGNKRLMQVVSRSLDCRCDGSLLKIGDDAGQSHRLGRKLTGAVLDWRSSGHELTHLGQLLAARLE